MSGIRDRSVVRFPVIPSAKYCCSGSLLKLAKGSTTIDGAQRLPPAPAAIASRSAGRAVEACAARQARSSGPDPPPTSRRERRPASYCCLISPLRPALARGRDQQRPGGLIERVDAHQLARIGQRLFRRCAEPLGQRAGESLPAACAHPRADPAARCGNRCSPAGRDRPGAARGRTMRRAPDRLSRQRLASAQACAAKKSTSSASVRSSTVWRSASRRGNAGSSTKRPDLAEAPAQRPARIVRHVPEHLAQLLAPVRAPGQSEIGEQRARLAGRRQRRGRAVADHLKVAEDPDFQHGGLSLQQRGGASRSRPIIR